MQPVLTYGVGVWVAVAVFVKVWVAVKVEVGVFVGPQEVPTYISAPIVWNKLVAVVLLDSEFAPPVATLYPPADEWFAEFTS